MLRAIGAKSIEDLLAPIPADVRLKRPLKLPAAQPERDVRRTLTALAEQNADLDHFVSFLGAGSYEHYVPSAVPHLVKRSEFYTSYTPYQPEVSQGMLQATYEFQTMVCQITGMDVANASLYDGATAVVEAALLAVGPSGTGEVLVSRALDPQYRATLQTYAHARGFTPARDRVAGRRHLARRAGEGARPRDQGRRRPASQLLRLAGRCARHRAHRPRDQGALRRRHHRAGLARRAGAARRVRRGHRRRRGPDRWATRRATVDPRSASSPRARSSCGGCRGVSSDAPSTIAARTATC